MNVYGVIRRSPACHDAIEFDAWNSQNVQRGFHQFAYKPRNRSFLKCLPWKPKRFIRRQILTGANGYVPNSFLPRTSQVLPWIPNIMDEVGAHNTINLQLEIYKNYSPRNQEVQIIDVTALNIFIKIKLLYIEKCVQRTEIIILSFCNCCMGKPRNIDVNKHLIKVHKKILREKENFSHIQIKINISKERFAS